MLTTILQASCGLAMLYFGGDFLVRGASTLAARLGVSSLAIGLTVVAVGTSAPELVVSVDAALSGANDISVGNVVGSNIANIALILGLAAILCPTAIHARVVRVDAPLMLVVSVLLVAVLANHQISRVEGCLLLLGLVAYTLFTLWQARAESSEIQDEFASAAPPLRISAPVSSLLVVTGLSLLIGGGHLLVRAAVELATLLGVGQAAIGLTIVAVGTSLPELATSLIASVRGLGDIAIGNIVGSNIFNILGIVGLTALVRPLELGAISPLDLGVLVGLACILTILLFTRSRIGRIAGSFLLASFISYTSWLLAA